MYFCSKYYLVVKMSTSRRIKTETEKQINELQALIVLKKGKKVPKIELIDRAIRFGRNNEQEFIDFVLMSVEPTLEPPDPFDFILDPVEGGIEEDFTEYDFSDVGGTE